MIVYFGIGVIFFKFNSLDLFFKSKLKIKSLIAD